MALAVVLSAASVGLTIFGALAWRAVTIQRTDTSDAQRRFASVRHRLPAATPLVHRDPSGRFVRGRAVLEPCLEAPFLSRSDRCGVESMDAIERVDDANVLDASVGATMASSWTTP